MDPCSQLFQIYGYSGKRMMGKTTAAIKQLRHLNSQGLIVKHIEIAQALKIMFANDTEGINEHRMLTDQQYKSEHRQELLAYGRSMETQYGKTYLIDNILKNLLTNTTTDIVIISDIRTRDELFKIRSFGTLYQVSTYITRMEIPPWVRSLRGYKFDHKTDTGRFEIELDDEKEWNEIRVAHEYDWLIFIGSSIGMICILYWVFTR